MTPLIRQRGKPQTESLALETADASHFKDLIQISNSRVRVGLGNLLKVFFFLNIVTFQY